MSKNVLLITDEMIKDRTAIHGNIDPKLIYPDIKAAQDLFIHPVLGSSLFDKLINDIAAGTLAGSYLTLRDQYICDALMYYVLSELPVSLSFQFFNKGVVRRTGEAMEAPPMSDLIDVANKYRMRAESYLERLKGYLMQNASLTLFVEYYNYTCDLDKMAPSHTTFTLPIYLGEGDCGNFLDAPVYQTERRFGR